MSVPSARTAHVIIASTRASAGVYTDRTGPIIADWLAQRGFAPAQPEVVPDGECGVLVKPGDAEGFAAALDRLLNDPSARQRLGQAGRRRAVQYDAPVVAEQFLAAIGLQ